MAPFLIFTFLIFGIQSKISAAHIISLQDAIKLAQEKDHRLVADHAAEASLQENQSIRSASYLPSLFIDAIDSSGFPGSNAQLNLGGITGSPFRSGFGVAAVLKQTIWDFGRTSWGVETAKRDLATQKAASQELIQHIASDATQAYFACVQSRSTFELWNEMENNVEMIAKEVSKFITTGQHSIVEKYLLKNQLNEIRRKRVKSEKEMEYSALLLNQVTFSEGITVGCSPLKNLSLKPLDIDDNAKFNPTYARIDFERSSAESQVMLAKADYSPKVVALGSFGFIDSTHLLPKNDYALGIGLEIPVFEGGITRAHVRQTENTLIQKENELLAQADKIKRVNLGYSAEIESETHELQSLLQEVEDAETGFHLAQSRYLKLQGTLTDLRETLKFLINTKLEFIDTSVRFLRHNAEKAILNGQINHLNKISQ